MRSAVFTGFAWLASQNIVRQLLSFAIFVILGRLLAPADFGTVALSSAILNILQSFSSQGLSQAVIQKQDLSSEEAEVAYTFNLFLSLILAAIIVLVCLCYGSLQRVGIDTFLQVLIALSMSIPISASFEIHQARLIREFNFGIVAKKAIASQFLAGAMAAAAAVLGMGVWSLVIQQFVVVLVDLLIIRTASKWRPSLRWNKDLARQLSSFSSFLFGARCLTVVDHRTPEVIIGSVYGQSFVGYYRVAKSLQEVVMSTFWQPIFGLALPVFARKQRDLKEVRHAFLVMTELVAWLILPPFLALAVWGPTLTTAVFGGKWSDSGWIIQILSLQCGALAPVSLYDPLFVGIGRTIDLFKVRCWQTGLTLLCTIPTALLGFSWLVFAQVAALYLVVPFAVSYISRSINLRFTTLLGVIWKPACCCVAFIALTEIVQLSLANHLGIVGLFVALGLSACIYAAIFLLFASAELRSAASEVGLRFLPRLAPLKKAMKEKRMSP
jgi:PST family polysaccharide transporter